MSGLDVNPFADPFQDASITQSTSQANRQNLENFDPFGSTASASKGVTSPPAAMPQFESPPPYSPQVKSTSAPPVEVPREVTIPGHDELLKRQEELERKAEELQKREQEVKTAGLNVRKSNWPPFPKCCPIGSCFYQDFSVDIPGEFRLIVKLHYYFWIVYVFSLFNNLFVCLVIFCYDPDSGVLFGMSILWFVLNSPSSLCWYRPIYNAFRKDSALYFFWYFFVMLFQFLALVVMAVGIPNAGWAGWITALGHYGTAKGGLGVGIYASIQASLFSAMAALSIILMKRVHSLYRSSGASFKKAQQEFAEGVMKNPGVQAAAATTASAAVQSNLAGTY